MELMINILIIWIVVNTICIVALAIKVVVLERKIKDNCSNIIYNSKDIKNNNILINKLSEILKEHTDDIKRIVVILTSHINNASKHN